MSTLFVYYSEDAQIHELCERSRADGTDTLEILEYFDRTPAYVSTVGAYMALTGKSSAIANGKADFSGYDTIIIAGPVWAGNPAPAVNAFLRANDLKGKEVIGLLFGGGFSGALANDVLRKRITLAGGTCRGVVSIPKRELMRSEQSSLLTLALARA